jgi:hypothetical protein
MKNTIDSYKYEIKKIANNLPCSIFYTNNKKIFTYVV